MPAGASIGFHTAYSTNGGADVVSSSGNAIVGAYLNRQWLTFDKAAQIGLEVRPYPGAVAHGGKKIVTRYHDVQCRR